nr:hypothetical protein [Lachnospiraceae bacterium]
MKYERKTDGLTFGDIVWKILQGWKLLLIFAIGCAVLTSVYVKLRRPADEAEYRKELEEYQKKVELADTMNSADAAGQMEYSKGMVDTWKAELTTEQLDAVENVLSIKKLIADTKQQMEESVIMKAYPYGFYALTAIYEIQTEAPENIPAIIAGFNNANSTGRFRTLLMEKMGWSTIDGFDPYTDVFSYAAINGNQFTITVIHYDEAVIKDVSVQLEAAVQEISADISRNIANHDVKRIEDGIAVRTNNTYASTKNTYQQWINSYINQINTARNTFNDTQIRLYNYLAGEADGTNGYTPIQAEDMKAPSQLKSLKVRVVIAFLFGIIIGALIIVLMMLFGGKLQKGTELAEVFEVPFIGVLLERDKEFIIDELLKKIKTQNEGPYDVQKRIDLATVRIQEICGREGITKTVLATTDKSRTMNDTLERLKDTLKGYGVEISFIGDINNSSEAAKNALEAGSCIIAEKID